MDFKNTLCTVIWGVSEGFQILKFPPFSRLPLLQGCMIYKWLWFFSLCEVFFFFFFSQTDTTFLYSALVFLLFLLLKWSLDYRLLLFSFYEDFGCYLFIFISVVGSLEFIYSKWSIRLYFVGWLCMRPTHTPALISTWCASEEPGESWTLRTSQSGSM